MLITASLVDSALHLSTASRCYPYIIHNIMKIQLKDEIFDAVCTDRIQFYQDFWLHSYAAGGKLSGTMPDPVCIRIPSSKSPKKSGTHSVKSGESEKCRREKPGNATSVRPLRAGLLPGKRKNERTLYLASAPLDQQFSRSPIALQIREDKVKQWKVIY